MKSRKSYNRNYNLRSVPQYQTYNVKEICDCLNISENTARSWTHNGLPVIDDKIPYLVHGTDLVKYLTTKQSDRKQELDANQLYCMKCRKASYALPDTVAFKQRPNKSYNVTGKCTTCETLMNRISKAENLHFFTNAHAQFTMQERRIDIYAAAPVNCESKPIQKMGNFHKCYNAENERIKRRYFEFVKETKGRHKDTMRGINRAIRRFEEFTRYADFKTFSKIQAMDFKKALLNGKAQKSKQPYSCQPCYTRLNRFKIFLIGCQT